MRLSDIFTADAIELELRATDKEAALTELATILKRAYPALDQGKILQVLQERERLGSTAIGEGVAIPHGKLDALPQVIGAFARSREGIDFAAYDQKMTHLFFILLAPEGQRGVSDHLKALAKISRLLRSNKFRDELCNAKSKQELYELLLNSDG